MGPDKDNKTPIGDNPLNPENIAKRHEADLAAINDALVEAKRFLASQSRYSDISQNDDGIEDGGKTPETTEKDGSCDEPETSEVEEEAEKPVESAESEDADGSESEASETPEEIEDGDSEVFENPEESSNFASEPESGPELAPESEAEPGTEPEPEAEPEESEEEVEDELVSDQPDEPVDEFPETDDAPEAAESPEKTPDTEDVDEELSVQPETIPGIQDEVPDFEDVLSEALGEKTSTSLPLSLDADRFPILSSDESLEEMEDISLSEEGKEGEQIPEQESSKEEEEDPTPDGEKGDEEDVPDAIQAGMEPAGESPEEETDAGTEQSTGTDAEASDTEAASEIADDAIEIELVELCVPEEDGEESDQSITVSIPEAPAIPVHPFAADAEKGDSQDDASHRYEPIASDIIAEIERECENSIAGDGLEDAAQLDTWEKSSEEDALPFPYITFADRYNLIQERRHETLSDRLGQMLFSSKTRKATPKQSRRYSHRNRGGAVFSLLIMLAVTFVLSTIFAVAMLLGTVASWTRDLPDLGDLGHYSATGITNIYASDNTTVLARVRVVNRIEVPYDRISQFVKDATVATEDIRFFEHSGVDAIGTVRAVTATLSGGQQGGSTITQQLVRNTVLLDEMSDISLKRKVREMALATEVEQRYSKEEILGLYLNIINYGDGCYGIEAASRNYFGIPASDLTLSQAALLAGIPQSPNYYNLRDNYEGAIARRVIILDHMLQYNYITQQQYDEAMADRPPIVDAAASDEDISPIAPYFVDYVKDLVASGEFGPAEKFGNGGIEIYTTLDVHDQQVANDVVADIMSGYEGMDAALASVDPDNGNIVAMVGGRNYEADKFNLATQMSRQAGSSFKTFALLAGLQQGVSPSSVKFPSDGPIYIGNWRVDNDSGENGGIVNLTAAFAHSYNTVYAMLTHRIGADAVAQVAKDCGIESNLNPVDSICLGTQGINPLEMANAYATIANGGTRHDVVAVTSIKTTGGDVLYEHVYTSGEKVLSDEVAQTAIKVMETVLTQGTGTAARLSSGQEAGGKTGTSENGRDLWFVGYTPQLSTAVWTGYRDDSDSSLYGGTTSTPIWRDFMNGALEDTEIEYFPSDATSPSYDDWSTDDFTQDVTRY